ncbi:DUF2007 domain-containing protein [Phenylobacterium sp.]|jgi:hypothetical protein|uniref:putative signal transducing protein n=1 Tax=Phenylobacterium sp. TaxID=1871053 RepID=UPI002F3ECF9E
MIAVLETHDAVRLHFLKTVLEEADLHPFVFGATPYPGALPSLLMVPEGEVDMARRLIDEVEKSAPPDPE